MRAKIIADIGIISSLVSGYIWWVANVPFREGKIDTWQQVGAGTLTILGMSFIFILLGYWIIRWIHQGK